MYRGRLGACRGAGVCGTRQPAADETGVEAGSLRKGQYTVFILPLTLRRNRAQETTANCVSTVRFTLLSPLLLEGVVNCLLLAAYCVPLRDCLLLTAYCLLLTA